MNAAQERHEQRPPDGAAAASAAPLAREIENVSLSYDPGAAPALENVSFSLPAGEIACVVGPNGGGKTTLFRLILGLLRPSRGRVRALGLAPEEARGRIGYAPQHFAFDPQFPIRVEDVARIGHLGRGGFWGGWSSGRAAALDALAKVGMEAMRHQWFSALSGGQRQRVLIARALVSAPELLLLDEPTANVDPVVEKDLLDLFESLRGRMTIVIITHNVNVVSRFLDTIRCVNRTAHAHPRLGAVDADLMRHMCGAPLPRRSAAPATPPPPESGAAKEARDA